MDRDQNMYSKVRTDFFLSTCKQILEGAYQNACRVVVECEVASLALNGNMNQIKFLQQIL